MAGGDFLSDASVPDKADQIVQGISGLIEWIWAFLLLFGMLMDTIFSFFFDHWIISLSVIGAIVVFRVTVEVLVWKDRNLPKS
jgi:hypothetical protein